MLLTVQLFAGLREAAGAGSVEVELKRGSTGSDLLEVLGERPGLAEILPRLPVRLAVNQSYVDAGVELREGDEVALIPPISGGSQIQVELTDQPLDVASITRAAGDPAAGAVVVFQGMTREVKELEYEAYRAMAESRMGEILLECSERFGLTAAIAAHRIGTVPLGEASVLVAVSAPHRPEAFEGARAAIDRIKAEAPVWKAEVDDQGSARRVEGSLPGPDLPTTATDSESARE